MNNTHSALIDITTRRSNRSPKFASKTGKQVADELFTGRDVRVDFAAELDYYDSPICCPDRICRTCGIDHDFRPDFSNTKTSIDEIAQILRVKTDWVSFLPGGRPINTSSTSWQFSVYSQKGRNITCDL